MILLENLPLPYFQFIPIPTSADTRPCRHPWTP